MSQVLLLNATYEPLRLISVSRAVVLLLQERAEMVHAGEGEIRAARMALPRPSVIRLMRFVRVPFRTTVPLSRKALSTRDGGLCQYCLKPGTTIDHVLPRSKGGKHVWTNVVLACVACNQKKADKLLSDLGWKLANKPKAPKATTWIVVGVRQPEWETFLAPATT